MDERPLVILDLDNTCISAVEYNTISIVPHPETYIYHDLENIYRIYERPGLQEFLEKLFKTYKVAIWTAAGVTYALFVIRMCIIQNHPERSIEFIMWDNHCRYSSRRSKGQFKNIMLLESLYHVTKMVLLDDNTDVLRQRKDTIDSRYFDVMMENAHHDTFLYHLYDIIELYFMRKKSRKYIKKEELQKLLREDYTISKPTIQESTELIFQPLHMYNKTSTVPS